MWKVWFEGWWVLKFCSNLLKVSIEKTSFIQITTNVVQNSSPVIEKLKKTEGKQNIFLHLTSATCTLLFPIIFLLKFFTEIIEFAFKGKL